MSPVATTQRAGSPFRKLTSFAWPVNVLNRSAGLPELNPDCPPSPQMIIGQTTPEPAYSNVPLSCVPPMRLLGSVGFAERLWNWIVDRPLLRLVIRVGTRERSCLQIG